MKNGLLMILLILMCVPPRYIKVRCFGDYSVTLTFKEKQIGGGGLRIPNVDARG